MWLRPCVVCVGSVFHDSDLMKNPIAGLMLGVLATVILQSSSTSSSIVIAMVSSGSKHGIYLYFNLFFALFIFY